MWIEDLTKAFYYLNILEKKWSVCVEKVTNNCITFSNGRIITIKEAVEAYDRYFYNNEITDLL